MTMERWIQGQQAKGNTRAVEDGRRILAEHGDIPLTFVTAPVENQTAGPEVILSPLSPETERLVEQMRRDGYAVYETVGKTPEGVKREGMKFWDLDPRLIGLSAAPALLAFKKDPSVFFLPGTMNIPHDKQVELISAEQVRVDSAYSGVGLVVREGKLPEWIELAWKHFKTTRVRPFGKDYGYNFTWTDTYENNEPGADRAVFGYWVEAVGADALLWKSGNVNPNLRLALLVEIPRK